MAINPETQYPGKIAPSTPDYPYGAARNITLPGDGTGTPWEAALVNDWFGFLQSLLSESGIVPSGSPEKVGASQYLDALKAIATTRLTYTDSILTATRKNVKVYETDYFDATFIKGSGAKWIASGNTEVGKAGTLDIEELAIYDANGVEFLYANTTVVFTQLGAGVGGADDVIFNAIMQAAKGADVTGVGRKVFALYMPNIEGRFYRFEDTGVIDGVDGVKVFGDGALMQRTGNPNATTEAAIRWYGATSKPVIQVKGQTIAVSNPNFLIDISDLTIAGYESILDPVAVPPSDLALAGVYIGALDGDNQNTLNRMVRLSNIHVADSRFGIYSGAPNGQNTDHAKIDIEFCYLTNNAQAGIYWGTGNALANCPSVFCEGNGWGADHFPADNYSAQIGANVYVQSGYMDLTSYTSTGKGDDKPIDADVYQGAGRVNINGAWSDTHGFFFYQDGSGQSYAGSISGVRHFEAGMDAANTPDSLRIRVPGTIVEASDVYGNCVFDSGLAGRPIVSGLRFIRAGATYKGSGVDTQRSLIVLGNAGNDAQVLRGGADPGVDLSHVGVLTPQDLQMGIHSAGDTQSRAIRQVLGSAATDSGFTEFFDAATGGKVKILNGYLSSTSPFTITPLGVGVVYYISEGQGQALRVLQKYSSDGTTPILLSSFIESFDFRNAPGASSDQITLGFPQRSSDPGYTSGDFWEGSVYYNTSTNKLRLNTGGSTWVDLNP